MATKLEGTIKFGADSGSAVDVSAEVFAATITEERETKNRRPTMANARASKRAGAAMEQLEVDFEELLDPSTSKAHKEVTAAIRRDDAKLWIELLLSPGVKGPTNPLYSGYVTVDKVTTGGPVGEELDQKQTWSFDETGLIIDDTV